MLQDIDIDKSPEVQYIRKEIAGKLPVLDIMDQFQNVRTLSLYKGEDIDCGAFKVHPPYTLESVCTIYGGSINDPSGGGSTSSRISSLKYLERLQSKDSRFLIMDYPTDVDISPFSSTDPGIKSIFSTKTTLQLTLQYIPLTVNSSSASSASSASSISSTGSS